MIGKRSIKELYLLALAEGEGVGTAYEYYVKRLLLSDWLSVQIAEPRVLVAGLPQKYGSSLDFSLLAREVGGRMTIVDDRPEALSRAQRALAQLSQVEIDLSYVPQLMLVSDLARLQELRPVFDLILTSEVLQRLPPELRAQYVSRLVTLAPQVAIFAPNGDNDAHVGRSGLGGLSLEQLEIVLGEGLSTGRNTAVVTSLRTGYVDMPPFPPGITRSATEREQASSGKAEAAAMWGLGVYARLEPFIPIGLRKRQSHIVYGLIRLTQR